jgi:Holliday junction resolvase
MTEQQYQKKISDKLEKEGYYVIKLIKTNKNGIPDLIAIKENNTIFVEVKTEKGVLSELQKFRLTELTNKGFECYYSNKTELIRWLKEDTIK